MQDDIKTPPPANPQPTAPPPQLEEPQNTKKWVLVSTLCGLLLVLIGLTLWLTRSSKPITKNTSTPASTKSTQPAAEVQGVQLATAKNYGNKYANGILPVGDGKYVTDGAKAGYVYVCGGYANNLKTTPGGAQERGPWFVNNNTQYDVNKKLHVQGSKTWQSSFSNNTSGNTRTIATNDLPSHATGNFPVSPTDPSYAYDRNPNLIVEQSLTYNLSANPSYGNPNCMGGEAGIMLTGSALFNGFDAGGRDAGAWEIQDGCSGHPQKQGEYHYHTLSSCIKDVSVKTVIGFALDGFPITGPQVGTNNILTTADLDECHGLTSDIILDGKNATTYHYVMTQDFPYSVSCFRAVAIQPPHTQ